MHSKVACGLPEIRKTWMASDCVKRFVLKMGKSTSSRVFKELFYGHTVTSTELLNVPISL